MYDAKAGRYRLWMCLVSQSDLMLPHPATLGDAYTQSRRLHLMTGRNVYLQMWSEPLHCWRLVESWIREEDAQDE